MLHEEELTPFGATSARKVGVRFVAATHRDLPVMVRGSDFGEDLLYRLDVIPITMPALRERPVDIPSLAQRFCEQLAAANGRLGLSFEPGAVDGLGAHDWPGNVRELQNVVERLTVFSDGERLTAPGVTRELAGLPASRPEPDRDDDSPPGGGGSPSANVAERRTIAERAAGEDAFERAAGNMTKAARLLGVSRRKLYHLLAELDLVS